LLVFAAWARTADAPTFRILTTEGLALNLIRAIAAAAIFFIVPWMVAFCALGGWAIEWQIPLDCADDAAGPHDEKGVTPSRFDCRQR
jgi:hypothetical protein